MIINGVELKFALYNADEEDTKKKYFDELNKMQTVLTSLPDGPEQEKNAYLCGKIKEFFDNIFGEGTGENVCGKENDLLAHVDAYDQIVSEQMRQNKKCREIMGHMKSFKKAEK